MIMNSTPLTNYLVPAIGNIAGVPLNVSLSGTALELDFSNVSLAGIPFAPQSVMVDNTQGLGTVSIFSKYLGLVIGTVGAGMVSPINFPALAGDIYEVKGNGICNFVFMNAPLLGTPSQLAVSVQNIPQVTANITNANLNVHSTIQQGSFLTGLTLAVGQTVVSGNINLFNIGDLVKVVFAIGGGATLSVAGEITLTLSTNNNVFYSENVYIPAVAAGRSILRDIDFNRASIAGAIIGTPAVCKLQISTALTAGTITSNWYID